MRLIVSGNFSQDALGPDKYRAILARLAAAPLVYLEAFRTIVSQSVDAGRLSSLHLPWFLTVLAKTEPVAAREAARELLPAYEKAVKDVGPSAPVARRAPTETARAAQPSAQATDHDNMVDRLQSRSAELQRLLQS
ncbi:MAG: hypothetical protein ABI664_10495 [bacterium]